LQALSFESEIRWQGLCLEGDEIGWHILQHCSERNDVFKENRAILAGLAGVTTTLMRMKEMRTPRKYRGYREPENFWHSPTVCGNIKVFDSKLGFNKIEFVVFGVQ
jgi:hypothetical protein